MIPVIIILALLHSFIDYKQIRENMHIYHGWETLAYFSACTPLLFWYEWYWILIFAITTRAAVFDILLNLLRGKKWHYNGAGASIIDKIENSLNIPHKVLKIWWIALYIGSIILYYAQEFYD